MWQDTDEEEHFHFKEIIFQEKTRTMEQFVDFFTPKVMNGIV